jgi:rubredoxin
MPLNDPFVCPKCTGRSEYAGRVSMPSQVNYRCTSCGHENWVAYRPDATPPMMQQQQPQPKKDTGEG